MRTIKQIAGYLWKILRTGSSGTVQIGKSSKNSLRQKGFSGELNQAPGPEDWERIYEETASPVVAVKSPVTQSLIEVTGIGDVLLEAGCGSAVLSAELALSGREIQLADFSPIILDRAKKLFSKSNLAEPETMVLDITQSWPVKDRSVDCVWSSGVLEHWPDEEVVPILQEMKRVSRNSVVSIVPYAGSIFYRMGKWHAERKGTWPYGREIPRTSFRSAFDQVGLKRVSEKLICPEQSAWFLRFIDDNTYEQAKMWMNSLPADDPLLISQGYLLWTIGYIE